jgi:hypothetical protein
VYMCTPPLPSHRDGIDTVEERELRYRERRVCTVLVVRVWYRYTHSTHRRTHIHVCREDVIFMFMLISFTDYCRVHRGFDLDAGFTYMYVQFFSNYMSCTYYM